MLTEYPNHLDKRIKKSYDNLYTAVEDNDEVINALFNVSISDELAKGYTSKEGVGTAAFFNEGEKLKNLKPKEGYPVFSKAKTYGGYIETTLEEILASKDATTLFKEIEDGKITGLIDSTIYLRRFTAIKLLVNGLLPKMNGGSVNPDVTLAPDLEPLFGTHKFKSDTTKTFTNKTDIPAGEKALDYIEKYSGEVEDSDGKPLPCRMNKIIVKTGGVASKAFQKCFSQNMKSSSIGDVNIYNDGRFTLLETPYIKDEKQWFAIDNKKDKALILDDVKKPLLDKESTWSAEYQTRKQAATGAIRILAADLPLYMVGSTGDGTI